MAAKCITEGREYLLLGKLKKIHFVGIGGAGMSAIAQILLEKGYEVTGSDLKNSDAVQRLRSLGAEIFIGQSGENVTGKDAIVVSTAISNDNPEVMAAKELNLKIFHRSDVVAYLLNNAEGIAVAGAHGKTTTTSMIGVVLDHAGLEPSIIIGGDVAYLGSNARLGKGAQLVAEADESDGSFLKLMPKIAVVTNIENDHMDHYGTMENILKAFGEFLHNLPKTDGLAVLCFDNENIRNIAKNLDRKFISYGIENAADYQSADIKTDGANTSFTAFKGGEEIGRIELLVPGRHNVLNALATVAVCTELGLSIDEINGGFACFSGAKRRFQTKGREGGVWVVDDYAHHPTEIGVTLAAARQTKPKRIVCAFQPHRYTRTQLLADEFAKCFDEADVLVLTDIYSAGEKPIEGIDGQTILKKVAAYTGKTPVYIKERADVAAYLKSIAKDGDLIMTMGAGDIYKSGEELVELLKKS
jgi:UDP-N-acetylmuramate--alanine ligase